MAAGKSLVPFVLKLRRGHRLPPILVRPCAAALGILTLGACVSRPEPQLSSAEVFADLVSKKDFSGVGLSVSTRAGGLSSPWTLRVEFSREGGGSTRTFDGTAEARQVVDGEERIPFLFPLPTGRWHLSRTVLILDGKKDGDTKVSAQEIPFTLAQSGQIFDVKDGVFVHLGEMRIDLRETEGTPRRIELSTFYVPFAPPRDSVWKRFSGTLATMPIETLSDPTQRPTPLLFDQKTDTNQEPANAGIDNKAPFVSLLANAPGLAFFEDESGRIYRVESKPLSPGATSTENAALHLFGLRVEKGRAVTFRGVCFPPVRDTPVAFLPDCPMETILASRDAKKSLEPFETGTVRYLGMLEVSSSTRSYSLQARFPEEARAAFDEQFGGAALHSFLLSEFVRKHDPNTWAYLDSHGAAVQGFLPPAGPIIESLQPGVATCSSELWKTDPLATTDFMLWISLNDKGIPAVERARSTGLAGPGFHLLKACLDTKLSALPHAKDTVLAQGFGIRFQ